MSNVQSYNALIDRFKAFASGHFILKTFSHGQIDTADLEKFTEYPFMHVVPSNVTYAKGTKTFSFQIVLADLPRDKDDKVEFQREVLSDLQRIAEDLVAEITNHRVLFGDLITVQNVSLEPFLEEFHNTLTGWTVSLELLVPYYWDACSIPAEWNDMFESSTGGTGSILTFIDSITRDENGNVSLVNDEATPAPNYYYGTNDEGVRGWYLLTDEVGLTCVTLPSCQTIIDIEAAIDLLQTDVTDLQSDVSSLETNKVPYTGATGNVNLGEFELKAGQLSLDTSPTGTAAVGTTRWNDTIGSSETTLKGGSVILKNGVDLVARVVNKVTPNTTLTKAAYQAVRISGAQGQRLAVALAQANNDTNSADTIGVVTETIATNQEGFIMTVGNLEEINTTGSLQGETWADGDVLYLSPTTAGAITNVKPTGATGHIVVIGYVEYAHAIHGKIYVKVMNGWELDELHNVYIDTPVNNNVLTYESSTSLWKNKTVATALGYTPVPETRTLTINGTTQDLSADRTFTIATGLTVGSTAIASGTVGRVLFEGTGNVLQQSTNLFWNATNNRLGVNTSTPASALQVVGTLNATNIQSPFIFTTGSDQLILATQGGTAALTIFPTSRNVLIQSGGTAVDAGYKLDVNGTARVGSSSASGEFRIKGGAGIGQYIYLDNGGSDVWTILGANVLVIDRGATRILRANSNAQVTINGNVNDGSAQMQIESTTRGFLPPRMTTTQKNAIASPAAGLVVYDTTLGKLCVRGASAWETITSV
jgi:nitrogen fixation protein